MPMMTERVCRSRHTEPCSMPTRNIVLSEHQQKSDSQVAALRDMARHLDPDAAWE